MTNILLVVLAIVIFGGTFITASIYLRSMAQLRELQRRSAEMDALIEAVSKTYTRHRLP
jgi:hypothetical protein